MIHHIHQHHTIIPSYIELFNYKLEVLLDVLLKSDTACLMLTTLLQIVIRLDRHINNNNSMLTSSRDSTFLSSSLKLGKHPIHTVLQINKIVRCCRCVHVMILSSCYYNEDRDHTRLWHRDHVLCWLYIVMFCLLLLWCRCRWSCFVYLIIINHLSIQVSIYASHWCTHFLYLLLFLCARSLIAWFDNALSYCNSTVG